MDQNTENISENIVENNKNSIIISLSNRLLELHNFFNSLLITPITFLIIIVICMILLLIVLAIYMHKNISEYNLFSYFDFGHSIENSQNKYFNSEMTYYVCSYGGCGSYMLCDYLRKFGNVEHIHSRKPPLNLEYIGKKNTLENVYGEWFNNVPIPENDLANYKVIYLYRNPVKAIYSRFNNPDHLLHIQCDPTIKLSHVIETEKDLYGIEEFFDNYTNKDTKRNYPIYCVKYEEFWSHISDFNKELGLPDISSLYPVKKETPRKENQNEILYKIYQPLMKKMSEMNFIQIV